MFVITNAYHLLENELKTVFSLRQIDLLKFTVTPFMVMHVTLSSEAFQAQWAGIRSFFLVNSLMNPQVLLLRKTLGTRRKCAAERLSAVVDMHVCLQPNTPLEAL